MPDMTDDDRLPSGSLPAEWQRGAGLGRRPGGEHLDPAGGAAQRRYYFQVHRDPVVVFRLPGADAGGVPAPAAVA